MEWEMPYMAQKAIQARRVRQMEMVDRDAAGETDDSFPPSEEGQDGIEDDHGSNDDVEAATSLLGGGKSRYHRIAAAVKRNEKDEKDDDNEGEGRDRYSPCLSLLAASLCPCYLLGRATTLLTVEEKEHKGSEDGNKKAARQLNREGWWTCLSSCLLASVCPLPCLWPTLACTHRRRQTEKIRRRYPHFPSLTPTSTSSSLTSSSSSSSRGVWSFVCESLWPSPLVEEVSYLEEMNNVRRRRRRRREKENIELIAALPLAKTLAAGKADGKGKGGAAAPVDTKWEPFEGWDMRPIVVAAAAAAAAAAAEAGGGRDEAEEIGMKEHKEEDDERSTKHIIVDR